MPVLLLLQFYIRIKISQLSLKHRAIYLLLSTKTIEFTLNFLTRAIIELEFDASSSSSYRLHRQNSKNQIKFVQHVSQQENVSVSYKRRIFETSDTQSLIDFRNLRQSINLLFLFLLLLKQAFLLLLEPQSTLEFRQCFLLFRLFNHFY